MISELARNTSWRVCLTHTNLAWSFHPDRLRRALPWLQMLFKMSKLRLSGRKGAPKPFLDSSKETGWAVQRKLLTAQL